MSPFLVCTLSGCSTVPTNLAEFHLNFRRFLRTKPPSLASVATQFVDLVLTDENEEKNATSGKGDTVTCLWGSRRRKALIAIGWLCGGRRRRPWRRSVQFSRLSFPVLTKENLAHFSDEHVCFSSGPFNYLAKIRV